MTRHPATDPELTELERLATVLATMPDGTVVSHRSAALLWGIWIPAFDAIEVTTPASYRGSRYTTSVQRASVVAHRRITAAEDVTEYCGLPITTPARTWLDLSVALGVLDLVAAGDSALRAGADHAELIERTADLRRTRGIMRARRAVPLLNARSRSRPESRIRGGIVLSGLPTPDVNQAVTDEHGQWLAEPDLSYKEARLALEYNGADHANAPQMRKDGRRLLDLQRADWAVRTYMGADAYSRLVEVTREVRALLLRRAPHLLTHRFRSSGE